MGLRRLPALMKGCCCGGGCPPCVPFCPTQTPCTWTCTFSGVTTCDPTYIINGTYTLTQQAVKEDHGSPCSWNYNMMPGGPGVGLSIDLSVATFSREPGKPWWFMAAWRLPTDAPGRHRSLFGSCDDNPSGFPNVAGYMSFARPDCESEIILANDYTSCGQCISAGWTVEGHGGSVTITPNL